MMRYDATHRQFKIPTLVLMLADANDAAETVKWPYFNNFFKTILIMRQISLLRFGRSIAFAASGKAA